ncbi:GatB/YqeY domain-containing protein [Aestuariimicrobium ganziense]|uniref:hypothetical protein n=1 Tax=Aestuariimicrobium ganziense TaxID=2773677 RepID=UPI001943D839|nr:hypothetical protein [Aestuariimicrobium ganziense]
MTLVDRIGERLKQAMRDRDRDAVTLWRTTLSAVSNAEAVPIDTLPPAGALEGIRVGAGSADAGRRELTDDDVRAIVRGEMDELLAAASEMGAHGHSEQADTLRARAATLGEFLDEFV